MRIPPEVQRRFEVRGVLGRGGMGVVLAAQDRELGRQVALKLLHSPRSERALERFRREGELTARLRHSGIVALHTAGQAGAVPYLAYELIPGARTLADVFPDLDRRRRLEVLREVAAAVAYAHAHGVVHRDLKPENVLVDPAGRAKVTDFGLAAAGDLERLTLTGGMLGTPGYMAPEQFRVGSEGVTPRADVWALGVLLYFALTDVLPFEAPSLVELERQVLLATPRRPREIDPSISAGLEAVCLKALRSLPEERYPDAGAMAAELEACLSGERPKALEEAAPRRSFLRAGLGVVSFVAATCAAVAVLRASGPERAAPETRPGPAGEGAAASAPTSKEERSGPRPASPAASAPETARLLALLSRNASPNDRLRAAWRLLAGGCPPAARERVLGVARRLGAKRPLWRIPSLSGPRARSPTFVVFRAGALLAFQAGKARRWPLPPPAEPPEPWPEEVVRLVLSAEGPVYLAADRSLRSRRRGVLLRSRSDEVPTWLAGQPDSEWAGVVLRDSRRRERVLVVDVAGARVHELPPGSYPDQRIAFSGDGRRALLLSGTPPADQFDAGRGEWTLFDLAVPVPRRLARGTLPARPERGAFAADGGFAVGTGAGHLLLYDAAGTPRGELRAHAQEGDVFRRFAHTGHVRGLAFSPDGRRLYSVGKGTRGVGHEFRCWDLERRQELWGHLDRPELPSSLSLSSDGVYLAIGSMAGGAEVWLVDPERL